jgi:hypothetical protein
MEPWQPFLLLHGPYRSPQTRRGHKVFCEIRGTVTGSEAPIAWPYAKTNGRPLILCGDLIKAVKQESSKAVAHRWGVSVTTVWTWRKALGVNSHNAGTRQLMGRVADTRGDDRLASARAKSKEPAALAKQSESRKGKPMSTAAIAAQRRAVKRPRSAAWRAKISEHWRQRGHPPGHPELKL